MLSDRRWTTIFLATSVLLNLFLGGLLLGRYFYPGSAAGRGGVVVGAAIRALPASERLRFAVIMRRHAVELRAGRNLLRSARQAAEDAVAAPHYDSTLVAKRFLAVRQAVAAQQALQHAALTEALGQLSASSRAAIVSTQQRP